MYGYEIDPENDSTVRMAEEAADMMLHAMFPGAMLVNALPIRKCHATYHSLPPLLVLNQYAIFLHGCQEQALNGFLRNVKE